MADTDTPAVGGTWTAFGTAHKVASVSHGGARWLPACDRTGVDRPDAPRHVLAHLGEDLRPSCPADRFCRYCASGTRR